MNELTLDALVLMILSGDRPRDHSTNLNTLRTILDKRGARMRSLLTVFNAVAFALVASIFGAALTNIFSQDWSSIGTIDLLSLVVPVAVVVLLLGFIGIVVYRNHQRQTELDETYVRLIRTTSLTGRRRGV